MILKYQFDEKKWTIQEAKAEETISFGFNKMKVSSEEEISLHGKSCSLQLKYKDGNVGPLIGIMAAMNKKRQLTGNGPLFQALQSEVMKRNGLTVVFSPETLSRDSITGFAYLPEKQEWVPVKAPLPHLVYNRIPFRKAELLPAFKDAANFFEAMRIPFFNPAFINKNKLYSLFSQHPSLKSLMPVSIPVHSLVQLSAFLKEHRSIYLKPASSAKGIGIFRLRLNNGRVDFTSHTHQKHYPSLDEFWMEKSGQLTTVEYIAQKEIVPDDRIGQRFDFRVHVHDGKDGYEVTGIGIRQSEKQDLTTHLPNGGVMLPYEPFRTEKHDRFFAWIVKEIGTMLTEEMGYFGEFSIDAGVAASGDYVIYEVNSKPMSFDEPHIEAKRISALADLFFRKTGF